MAKEKVLDLVITEEKIYYFGQFSFYYHGQKSQTFFFKLN